MKIEIGKFKLLSVEIQASVKAAKLHKLSNGTILLFIIYSISFISCSTNRSGTNNSLVVPVQVNLEKEFREIQLLPNAKLVDCSDSNKSSQGFVECSYKTEMSYPQMRAYYDTELLKHNWKFYQQHEVTIWGKNFGGKILYYCKGEYRASLQYAGEQADYEWDYAFNMQRGADSLEDKYFNKFEKVGCN